MNHNKYIIHIIPATFLNTFQNYEFNVLQYTSRKVFHYTYFWFSFIFSHAFGRFSFLFTHIYRLAIFGSLSKGVFEQRTSTGGVLFAFFGNGFVHIFEQLVSIRVKKPRNTNLVASRCNKISSRAPECVVR